MNNNKKNEIGWNVVACILYCILSPTIYYFASKSENFSERGYDRIVIIICAIFIIGIVILNLVIKVVRNWKNLGRYGKERDEVELAFLSAVVLIILAVYFLPKVMEANVISSP